MIPHSRPTLGREEQQAVLRVLRSGCIASGKKVAEFEKALAAAISVKHAVAVNSGTSAIQLALEAKGLRGARVAVPTYSCNAVAHAVLRSGNVPVLIAADSSLNIDPAAVAAAKPDAVIAAHMHGIPCAVRELREYCDRSGAFLLEDCAQSLGASAAGKKTGSWGDASVFSFYATKMICTGEGGMVATNDAEIADAVRERISCGFVRTARLGRGDFGVAETASVHGNFKMTDIQAAMGVEQLKKLGGFVRKRKEIAARYRKAGIECLDGAGNVFYRFIARTDSPEESVRALFRRGVAASVLYPAIHEERFFGGFASGGMRETGRMLRSFVSLPIYPSLSTKERDSVLNAFARSGA